MKSTAERILMAVQTVSTDGDNKAPLPCLLCNATNQAEFGAEVNIHFRGLKIDNPGILFLPKVLVCLDCGFSHFRIPETELAVLVKGTTN
jgi:hypothetical protein